jgi:putative ABC transport system substrate-binding protein
VTDRRAFLGTLGLGVLTATLIAEAQLPGQVWRIGFLEAGSSSVNRHFLDAFRQGLSELGYVEGQQIVIEDGWAEGRNERFPGLAAELIQRKVDVIVVASTAGVLAAKNATTTIPTVFVGIGDPIKLGVVASLSRPGGNMTGLSNLLVGDLSGKWVELLKEVVPKVRMALLWNPDTIPAANVKPVQDAAKSLRVRLDLFEVREFNDFDGAFEAISKQHVGGLIVNPDPLTVRYRARIVELAAESKIPAMYGFPEFVHAGGLMAYGPNMRDLFRRAATFVDKILKGTKPADLPVEQPTKFELVINLKTAKALGLTIPPSLLQRADEVIQ